MTTSNNFNASTAASINTTGRARCGTNSMSVERDASDIVCLIVVIVLLVTSSYIFLVLCMSLHRFLKKRRGRTPSVNTTSVLANTNSKLGLSMRFVATGVSLLCVVHFTTQTVVLYYECCPESIYIVKVLIYSIAIVLSYVFFWLRQRVLYDAPTMRLFHSKLLRTLSWLSLGLIIFGSVLQMSSALLLQEVKEPTWIYLSWLMGCIFIQGVLLSLFLYPLRKHRDAKSLTYEYYERKRSSQKKPKRSLQPKDNYSYEYGIRDSNIFTVTTSVGPKGSTSSIKRLALSSSNPLYHAARRCVICASFAFISDVFMMTFTLLSCRYEWNSKGVRIAGYLLCNVNLIVSAVVIVVSFGTWRRMLFPDCIRALLKKGNCFHLAHSLRHKVFTTINYQGR